MVRGRQTSTARKAAAIKKDEPVVVVDEEEPEKNVAEEVECDEAEQGDEQQDVTPADDGTEPTSNPDEKLDESDEVIKLDEGEEGDEKIDDEKVDEQAADNGVEPKSNTDEKGDESGEVIKLDEDEEANDGPTSTTDKKDETENCEDEKEKKPEVAQMSEEDIVEIKKMLTTKTKIGDGKEVLIYSLGPPAPISKNRRSVVCHLCRVANIGSLASLKLHMAGKRHQEYLKKPYFKEQSLNSAFPLIYNAEGDKVIRFNMFPGENIETVTDAHKDRISGKPEWSIKPVDSESLKILKKDRLYEYNRTNPVIGLGYILKMKFKNASRYFCVLCDAMIQEDQIYAHVTDLEHQTTFIIKHFPKLYEKVICGLTTKKGVSTEVSARNIFLKLYRKLEVKHGYKKMVPVDARDFRISKQRYISKVREMHHYNEETYKFDDEEVNLLIQKINHNINISKPDPPTLPKFDPNVPPSAKKRTRPVVGRDMTSRRNTSALSAEADINKIKSIYKGYKENPESHPDYKVEWRKFWHERSAQLRAENINPKTYNFEKEWLPHWNRHLRKLYLNEIFAWKMRQRNESGMANDGNTTMKKLGPYQTPEVKNLASMLTNQRSSSAKIGLDTFHKNPNVGVNQRGNRRGPRGDSPPPKQARYQMQEPVSRQRRRAPTNVVSVLRLLTALEDQLGSLGPKSVQLLSKAVVCEKNNRTSDLLVDSDVYVFFATAREKLKGQIYADVIERSKIEAVKGAISDLNEITTIMDRVAPKQAVIKIEDGDEDCFIDDKYETMGRREVFKFEKTDDYNYGDSNKNIRDSNSGRDYRNDKNNDSSRFQPNNEMDSSHGAGNFGRNNNNNASLGQRNFSNAGNQGNFNDGNMQRNYNSGSQQHRFNDSGSQRNVHDSPAPRNFNEHGNYSNQSMSAANYRPNNGEMSNYVGANSRNAQSFNNPPDYRENISRGNFNQNRNDNTPVGNYGYGTNMNTGPSQMYRGNNYNAPTAQQNVGNYGPDLNRRTVYSSGSQGGSWIGGNVYPNTKPNNSGFGYNSGLNMQPNSHSMAANNSFPNYGNYGPSYN